MDAENLKIILDYIDEHIYEKISLLELARVAGYSPFYFSKMFAETIGIPVTGYIRVRKLQYALCTLLKGKKVLDVSIMYAFDSHEGFTRSFTQLFGSTPSKVKKYLTYYSVPELVIPDTGKRREFMKLNKRTLVENMNKIVFEVLRTSLEEVEAGYCSEIVVKLLSKDKIEVSDNGRGIPLSEDSCKNKKLLDDILAGHPISSMEYARMGDFSLETLQVVNSLCEYLKINVYRNGKCFQQEYVRGIAQHDIVCKEMDHKNGTEMILKPDSQIFGGTAFSVKNISEWVKEHKADKVIKIIENHEL